MYVCGVHGNECQCCKKQAVYLVSQETQRLGLICEWCWANLLVPRIKVRLFSEGSFHRVQGSLKCLRCLSWVWSRPFPAQTIYNVQSLILGFCQLAQQAGPIRFVGKGKNTLGVLVISSYQQLAAKSLFAYQSVWSVVVHAKEKKAADRRATGRMQSVILFSTQSGALVILRHSPGQCECSPANQRVAK